MRKFGFLCAAAFLFLSAGVVYATMGWDTAPRGARDAFSFVYLEAQGYGSQDVSYPQGYEASNMTYDMRHWTGSEWETIGTQLSVNDWWYDAGDHRPHCYIWVGPLYAGHIYDIRIRVIIRSIPDPTQTQVYEVSNWSDNVIMPS